jgi:hypothetical protein
LRNVSNSLNKIKRLHIPEESSLRIMFWCIHICHTMPAVAITHLWEFAHFHERNLKFSEWVVGRLSSPAMWRHVSCWKFSEVSEESAASFLWLLMTVIYLLLLDLARPIYLPCWLMQVVHMKRRYTSTKLQDIKFYKTLISTWSSRSRALWYNYENNQQDALYRLIYYSK